MNRRSWLRLVLASAALLLAASWGLSLALSAGWGRRPLLARLTASFGRPVEVRSFGFSLLGGPRLEANTVTVGEDPRFGQEYFLRADQLTASLRWFSLLRGRVEFSSLSLDRPSLNIVRAPDGSWNIESWLPPTGPSAVAAVRTAASSDRGTAPSPLHFSHVSIDGGRINFKRGADKLPFALVDVSGSLDQDSAGRWSIDLSALPMRVPVVLQQAGMVWLRGSVAGTSARLRPAKLELSWEDASLADAVRLAFGSDFGLRGTFGAELAASTDGPAGSGSGGSSAWNISGVLRLAEVHRWDLLERDSDPAVNLKVNASWRNGEPHIEFSSIVLEAPRSRVDAQGEVSWEHGFDPQARIADSTLSLADLLEWRRAFSPNTADALALEGALEVSGEVAGWPPQVRQAHITSTMATLRGPGLPGAIRIAPAAAKLQHGVLSIVPFMVTLPGVLAKPAARNTVEVPAPAGSLRIEAAIGPLRPGLGPVDWPLQWGVSGQTVRVEDLATTLAAFGWRRGTDWTVDGPARMDLRWSGSLRKGAAEPSGSLDFAGLRLASAALNQPVVFSAAHVELRPGERHVGIASAQAFGARWNGSLDWQSADRGWSFDLTADQLDAAELDRWVGPRARGLLERLLPFAGSSDAPAREAAIAQLRGSGRLRVADLALAPVHLQKLDGLAEISGRKISLRRAQASLYGGRVAGEFEAQLSSEPVYAFDGQIERANVAALAGSTPSLAGRVAGWASGRISLTAHGVGRAALLASLEGQGALEIRDAMVGGLPFAPAQIGGPALLAPASENRFGLATAGFRIQKGRIRLDRLFLAGRGDQYQVTGTIGFAQDLDLRVERASRITDSASAAEESDSWPANRPEPPSRHDAPSAQGVEPEASAWMVRGTLDMPQVSRPPGVPANAGVPAARR